MPGTTIGKAAAAAGVNVETIRYYERRGLIEQPEKPAAGGYRTYPERTIRRVRFIRHAQGLGFSLREAGELARLREGETGDAASVRDHAAAKLADIEAKIADLQGLRDTLTRLVASCPGSGPLDDCAIMEALETGATEARPPALRAGGTEAEMQTTRFTIDGMHCAGCARTVELLLRAAPGVHDASAAFDTGRARVLHDPATVAPADLAARVAAGGFTATPEEA